MSESLISFTGTPYAIGDKIVVRVPKDESKKLPSRGLAMVTGMIDGRPFERPIEPDGEGSHFLELTDTNAAAGKTIEITMNSSKDWPEPTVPADIQKALDGAPDLKAVWDSITPMSRWDWVRWVVSTKNPMTRAKRVVVMLSKMENGKRRACCFDRTICANPDLSAGGVLLPQA